MYRITIIEDDLTIMNELSTLLSNKGYLISCIDSFTNVLNQVKENKPDLILLDINLPIQDGFKICNSIRKFSNVPILFVTGRNTSMDELLALTIGGDDYITKPYNIPILLARINLLLAKAKKNSEDNIEYKGISISLSRGSMFYNSEEIDLTKTEIRLIYYLFTHTNTIIPRVELIEYLWDNQIHIDDNTLSVNISRLREKLQIWGFKNIIQTKRGLGYIVS